MFFYQQLYTEKISTCPWPTLDPRTSLMSQSKWFASTPIGGSRTVRPTTVFQCNTRYSPIAHIFQGDRNLIKDLPVPGYTKCSVTAVPHCLAVSLVAGSQSRCSRSGVASRLLQHRKGNGFATHDIFYVQTITTLVWSSACGEFT